MGRLEGVDPLTAEDGEGFGLVVGGVPIGDDAFVRAHIEDKVNAALEQLQKTVLQLRCVHQQSLWVRLQFCLRPKLDYWAQTCHGEAWNAAFLRFDEAVLEAASTAVSQPLHQLDATRLRRVALPSRLYGCGLRRLSSLAPVAFAGTICRIAPMLIDRNVRGTFTTGFLSAQLTPLFGAGSFD